MSTATEFFDQFPPLEQAATWPANSAWCRRHWAPCPLLRANGIGAAVELMTIFTGELLPPWANSPRARNRELAKQSPLCCKLGDQRMYELWGHWPPSTPTKEDS
jgi:hypothetical protein